MLVSVIIPTYNSAKYISRAVESVLNQTYQDFEIIIIDDGSTDNTGEIVQSIKDDRITYIKQENAGPAAARNKGLEIAKGEYIAFLDADDMWKANKLETQIKCFSQNDKLCLAFSAMDLVNEDLEIIRVKRHRKYTNNELLKQLLTNYPDTVPMPSTVMIKKSYLNEVGYFYPELFTGEDFDLWLRLILKGDFEYIDESLTVSYKPESSITSSIDYTITEKCHEKVLDRFFSQENLDKKILKLKNAAYSFIYYDISRLHFYRDRKNAPMDKVLKAFYKSFKYDPLSYFTVFYKGKFLVRIVVKLTTRY